MRILIYIGALLLISSNLRSQQLHAWDSPHLRYQVNPGVVNLYDLYTDGNPLNVDLTYSRQWTGYEDAPQTISAGVQYSSIYSHMTFGGFVANDLFGPTDYTEVQLQYSYQIHFERSEQHFLSVGLALSAMQIRIQESQFRPEVTGDPLLSIKDQSKITPNIGLGIYYQNNLGNGFSGGTFLYGAISAQQLVPAEVQFDGLNGYAGNLERAFHTFGFAGIRHYYDRRGHDYLEPYASIRYVPDVPIHYDLGYRMTFARKRLHLGLGYGSTFQAHWQVGVGIADQWTLRYTNNFHLGKTLGSSAGANHQVTLSFRAVTGW